MGAKDIFVKEWDDLSDDQRAAAETLGYTKETWEDPTTGAIAVSNVVGVDGTPTEVHVPAGAVDFKMSFSTGGALGVQFEIFPLCGDWMRHLHTEILEKGADDKLASATPLFPDVSLTYKSTAAGTDPINIARDSIEALEHESWGGRPGSGPFFGEGGGRPREEGVSRGTPASYGSTASAPARTGMARTRMVLVWEKDARHSRTSHEPVYVFLEAGCNRIPISWTGRSSMEPGRQRPASDHLPRSDNVHGTIQVSGANSRGFGAPPPARRARPRLRNTHPAPRRRPARHQDAHPADDHAARTPPAHRGGCGTATSTTRSARKIEEKECKADAECKWEADKCVTALSDTDHLDFHATYKYVVEEGGMCAATYAAAVASHSVAFPPREPYMPPPPLYAASTPRLPAAGFEAMRKMIDPPAGFGEALTFQNRRLDDRDGWQA